MMARDKFCALPFCQIPNIAICLTSQSSNVAYSYHWHSLRAMIGESVLGVKKSEFFLLSPPIFFLLSIFFRFSIHHLIDRLLQILYSLIKRLSACFLCSFACQKLAAKRTGGSYSGLAYAFRDIFANMRSCNFFHSGNNKTFDGRKNFAKEGTDPSSNLKSSAITVWVKFHFF